MKLNFSGKIPAKARFILKSKSRKNWHYNDQGYYIARHDVYKSAKAAAMSAIQNGYRPDIERLEDIRLSWAAYRFNGNKLPHFTEVEENDRGAFRVWIFPVLLREE